MAIKIKKRTGARDESSDIIEELPDEILAKSQETFSWLTSHRTMVIAGLVTLVIAAIAITTISNRLKHRHDASSAALYEAVALSRATVGEAPVGGSSDATNFETVAAQLSAVRDAAQAVLSDFGKSKAAGEASLMLGAAQLGLGNAAEAVSSIRNYVDEAQNPLERSVGTISLAMAQAEAGELSNAVAMLDDLGSSVPAVAWLAAEQRARLIDAHGDDPQRALDAYRAASELATEDVDNSLVESRLVQLEIDLGVEPEPEADDAAVEEGE